MAYEHFDISSEDGKLNIELKPDTLNNEESWKKSLLEELRVVSEKDELSMLNLPLPSDADDILDKIACIVAKIVLRKACKNVKVPDCHLLKIRGKVQGFLFQDVKKILGDSVCVETGRSTLQTRDVISFTKFTSKITSEGVTPEFDDIIEKLNSLNNWESVPKVLLVAVINAYKKVRKTRLTSDEVFSMSEETKWERKSASSVHIRDSSSKKENKPAPRDEAGLFVKEGTGVEQKSGCSSASQEKGRKQYFGDRNSDRKRQRKGKICYVCKNRYNFPKKAEKFMEFWRFYPRMCKTCAELNFLKRHQRVDLTGKYAVVTGGRIKIGYELVLKLLRDGCFVIVTTRFPHNASKSFAAEKDFKDWQDRLKIYGLDLKDMAGQFI